MQIGKVRFFHDAVAFVLHLAAVILTLRFNEFFFGTWEGGLLFATELIALVAHTWYLAKTPYELMDRGYEYAVTKAGWNSGKWNEYALSATTGTLATFVSGGEARWGYIMAIVLLGLVQQSYIGKTIDNPKSTKPVEELWLLCGVAWCIQLFEFAVVYTFNTHVFVFAIYAVSWSSFGLVAMYQLKFNLDPQRSEAWYSFLSYLAKLSVFAAVWAESEAKPKNRNDYWTAIAVFGAVVVMLQAVVMWKIR